MKVGIICNLANGAVGGQTAKTIQIIEYLRQHCEIEIYDLWPDKSKLKLFTIRRKSRQLYRRSDSTILILNTKGTTLVLSALKFDHRFKKKPIFEIAVGGTRQEKAKSSRYFRGLEKCVNKIFVETSYMADEYHKLGLSQAEVLANSRDMSHVTEPLFGAYDGPLLLCTYSRVVEDKGIDTAVAITKALLKKGVDATLDIYGPIDKSYQDKFSKLKEGFGKEISYKGVVDQKKAADTLKKYHLLLFPTRHASEGFPGTFIDAMEAGLVIISSYNNNFTDIVKDGENGYLIKNATIDEYVAKIISILKEKDALNRMRQTSYSYSKNYSNDVVLGKLLKYLEE